MPWENPLNSVRPVRPRESADQERLSRPFRPRRFGRLFPRASAFGLSPGLYSAGPLGRSSHRRICDEVTPAAAPSADPPASPSSPGSNTPQKPPPQGSAPRSPASKDPSPSPHKARSKGSSSERAPHP